VLVAWRIGPKLLTNPLKCAQIIIELGFRGLCSEVCIKMKEFPGTALNTLVSLVLVLLSLKELLAVGAVSGRRAQ
jgi:hypothetical protein